MEPNGNLIFIAEIFTAFLIGGLIMWFAMQFRVLKKLQEIREYQDEHVAVVEKGVITYTEHNNNRKTIFEPFYISVADKRYIAFIEDEDDHVLKDSNDQVFTPFNVKNKKVYENGPSNRVH